MQKIIIIALALIIASCSSNVRFSSQSASSGGKYKQSKSAFKNSADIGKIFNGKASYYADKYHGRMTANGEIFDMHKLSAAHKTLPFGTKLRVTNLKNNKSVVVVVNDRGPFIKGRILDLSKAAAEAIDMLRDGVAEVSIEIIQ